MSDKLDKYVTISSTCKSQAEAKKIARLLLERKLAACVQLEAIQSLYSWHSQIVEDSEFRLTIKTKASLYKQIEAFILKNNSYDTPEIIISRIVGGSADYLAWMSAELADK